MRSHSLLLWTTFILSILTMLFIDLKVFHKPGKAHSKRSALVWSIIWTIVALIFNAGVWIWMGRQPGIEFFTGYLIERALSMDNLFVFLLIFTYFRINRNDQHTILLWGILGAIVMRLLFILLGAYLVSTFSFILYIFGVLLVISGVKLLKKEEKTFVPENNLFFRIVKRIFPFTHEQPGGRFFVRQGGLLKATPFFAVLVLIETSDVIFAIDSIPAIFGITLDTFIIFSSNIFAILGLRALYHLIAGLVEAFHYLHYGLALILVFIGVKMLGAAWFHISAFISLLIIGLMLIIAILLSWLIPPKAPIK